MPPTKDTQDSSLRPNFWTLPLDALNEAEWEALCDRCGKCCLIKLEDEDTGEILYTSLACKLFDSALCACGDYPNRRKQVEDCLSLDIKSISTAQGWLPRSCAYVLRYHNKDLPDWHPLIDTTGALKKAEHSMRNRTQSEDIIDALEEAIPYIDRTLGP